MGKRRSAQKRERQPLQPGWHDGHAQGARMDLPGSHPPPSGLSINSHTMDHRNRGSHTVGINHDYFRDMQRRHHASRPAKVTCLAEL